MYIKAVILNWKMSPHLQKIVNKMSRYYCFYLSYQRNAALIKHETFIKNTTNIQSLIHVYLNYFYNLYLFNELTLYTYTYIFQLWMH